ncbi:glycosyltransferase [Parasphingopyxis lamellibrachiae]|uniref:Glycosyltransferase involved in cell wall biosynthesis n=1 Tax=Parasphingopyxis lamellibrachiae TaxID=680125 RepID=A0A3D9FET5_9SPHN|nr:glycosyltransferase [Parasphingopyxis lamellibrachiae]RED16168.1 glycosyltransferase involved in cell wall biosynthesis [Parasphingopyxis lamellibrachiae]
MAFEMQNTINVYVAGCFAEQDRWNDLICRLAWHLSPYLDKIGVIKIQAKEKDIEDINVPDNLDTHIQQHIDALKAKISLTSEETLRSNLNSVDPRKHLFLLADEGSFSAFADESRRFSGNQRFFRIDPQNVRMEGSFYLWATLHAFRDEKAEAEKFSKKFAEMADDIGEHDKSYVFGTGPSLSKFVDENDFADGLTIVANSIVMNDDILDKLAPRIIAAGDPIFHAGCSNYAAAFRTALVKAMDKTEAWLVCPLRDVQIYLTYLPQHVHDRIVGIPFDAQMVPPSDLTENFRLKPYGNILTLMLLPLASTFSRNIHIAGCDGRPVSQNSAFWAHDKKAQFVDKMDDIKTTHPAFFAIDYNDYYLEHNRNLETVLSALESDGRTCVNETQSYLPALFARNGTDLLRAEDQEGQCYLPETVAIIDPDAKGEWGHFLSYDRRLGEVAENAGLDFYILCRKELSNLAGEKKDQIIPVFSRHSWTLGNKWPDVKTEDLDAFATEIEQGIRELERKVSGDILLFMYCGSIEVADILEHVLVSHPRVRAVINLFWAYGFDITDPAYTNQWRSLIQRLAKGTGRVRIMHSTQQITADYFVDYSIEIPVLPHPSTTFGDVAAQRLASDSERWLRRDRPARILFPGGARPEKGYAIGAKACEILDRGDRMEVSFRARKAENTPGAMLAVLDALKSTNTILVEEDFENDDFVSWLKSADVIVVPYLPEAFSNRTSGMLVDAMLLGIPVVAVQGTWLADEIVRHGTGVAVRPTGQALAEGVQWVLERYSDFASATRNAAMGYLRDSTWTKLLQVVLDQHGVNAEAGENQGPAVAITSIETTSLWNPTEACDVKIELAENSGALLLCYEDPILMLSRVIEADSDHKAFLARWRLWASEMLDVVRKNRDRLILVELENVQQDPNLYRVAFAEKSIQLPNFDGDSTSVPCAASIALARIVLERDAVAHCLFQEMQASALRPANIQVPSDLTIQEIAAQYREIKSRLKAADSLRGALQVQNEKQKLQTEEISVLRENIKERETLISEIRQSGSWRATAPLRWIKANLLPERQA